MQRFVSPPPDLRPWLEAAVAMDSPAELGYSQFPAMVGSMLVVRLAGEVLRGDLVLPASVYISASTVATVYAHCGRVRAVGLVLKPEAGAALFPRARGLVNTIRPMAAVAGPLWMGVEQAVHAGGHDDACISLLWQFVRQTIEDQPHAEERRTRAKALLDDAAQGSGQGVRQLERCFAAEWGMSPKQFAVVTRLNATLLQAVTGPAELQGAHLAVDQGYYDQSHMARDVRRLAGRPLQGLVQEVRKPVSEHWPLQVGVQARQAAELPRKR